MLTPVTFTTHIGDDQLLAVVPCRLGGHLVEGILSDGVPEQLRLRLGRRRTEEDGVAAASALLVLQVSVGDGGNSSQLPEMRRFHRTTKERE